MSSLSVIDLFCGGGGFSQGFAEAEYDIVAGIDIDDDALTTFNENHDGTAINADLYDANPHRVTKNYGIDRGEIDVVIGGPPCQGFSAAGKNEDDERNDLVREYFEWVEYLEPSYWLLENVPGLLNHDNGKLIDWIIGRAEYLDYTVDYDVHNADEYGIPQDRERLIIVGGKNGVPEIAPNADERYQTVADVLGDGVPDDASNHERANHSDRVVEKYCNTDPGESVHGHYHQYRLEWDEPAHTVTASNRDWHPEEPRALTIREQARLQTFPDDYEFSGPKHKQQKQVGNAIPVRLARGIGEQIVDGDAGDGIEIDGSFITKDINGSGPYIYRVSPEGNWTYLGRADGRRAYAVRAADD